MQGTRQSVIYVWLDPATGAPVYVGKTAGPLAARMATHRRREAMGIPSYASVTGNDGRIRVGDPHRRWAGRA